MIAKNERSFTHRDSAAEIQDDDVVQTPGIENHAHCGFPRIFLTIRSLHPPPSRCCKSTSSINDRMIKMPRPLGFRRFALSVGSAILSSVNPHPWSSTMISMLSPVEEILRVACLEGSALFPCWIALIIDSLMVSSIQCANSSLSLYSFTASSISECTASISSSRLGIVSLKLLGLFEVIDPT